MTQIEKAWREGFSRGITAGHAMSSRGDRDEDRQWAESEAKESETGSGGCTVWVVIYFNGKAILDGAYTNEDVARKAQLSWEEFGYKSQILGPKVIQ